MLEISFLMLFMITWKYLTVSFILNALLSHWISTFLSLLHTSPQQIKDNLVKCKQDIKFCMASNTVDQNRNGRLAAMSTSHLKSEEAFKMQAGKLSAFSDSYDVDA